jgi:hypothetical protein
MPKQRSDPVKVAGDILYPPACQTDQVGMLPLRDLIAPPPVAHLQFVRLSDRNQFTKCIIDGGQGGIRHTFTHDLVYLLRRRVRHGASYSFKDDPPLTCHLVPMLLELLNEFLKPIHQIGSQFRPIIN